MQRVPVVVTGEDGEVATVYSDVNLENEVDNPTTDSNGVYSFYLSEGVYSIALDTEERYEPIEGVEVVGSSTRALATTRALDGVSAGLEPAPLSAVEITDDALTPRYIGYALGYLWGNDGTAVKRSEDMGATWSATIFTAPCTPTLLLECADGEVMVLDEAKVSGGLWRSTGFPDDPDEAEWDRVVQPSGGADAYISAFNISGDGTKFIVGEYGGPVGTGEEEGGWSDSRYAWISLDAGVTWDEVYDTRTMWPEVADYSSSHIHATCYDDVQDRFYLVEGHGTPHGIYVSDDDGATWGVCDLEDLPEPGPTVMIAAEHGLCCGTDSHPVGVYVIPRVQAVDDPMEWKVAWHWQASTGGLYAWCYHGHKDPDTGLVYLAFRAESDLPARIAASNGRTAAQVWEAPYNEADTTTKVITRVFAAEGKLAARYTKTSGAVKVRAVTSPTGVVQPRYNDDTGRVLGGTIRATVNREFWGIAVGPGALSIGSHSICISAYAGESTANHSICIGRETTTGGEDSIAIGRLATTAATGTICIGRQATATLGQAVIIGHTASAVGAAAVVVGGGATGMARSVTIGYLATVDTDQSIAIGYQASAPGAANAISIGVSALVEASGCIAIGYEATVAFGSGQPMALGYQAQALHGESVALGSSSVTTQTAQVALGGRRVLLLDVTAPAAPTAGSTFYSASGVFTIKNASGNVISLARQSAITAPTGGATIDAEARTAINSIRTALTAIGLTA